MVPHINWGTRTPPEVDKLKIAYIYQRGTGMTEDEFHKQAEALLKTPECAKSGMLEALLGISFHEKADAQFVGFLVGLHELVGSHKNDLSAVKREEVRERLGRSELGPSLVEAERQALVHFERADRLRFVDKFFSPDNTFANQIDLEYRTAQRIQDSSERDHELARLQERLLAVSDEANPGIAAENRLIWLLRKMFQEQRIDHLVYAEHATVKDDLCGGPDIIIFSPFGRFDIQLKALSASEYTEGYNENLKRSAEEKVADTQTKVVTLESGEFNSLIRAERSGKVVAAKRWKAVLEKLSAASPSMEMKMLAALLMLEPVVSRTPRQTKSSVRKKFEN